MLKIFSFWLLIKSFIRLLSIGIDDNELFATAIAKELGLSVRAIEKNIKDLRENGKLIRHGSARGGYWEVKEF